MLTESKYTLYKGIIIEITLLGYSPTGYQEKSARYSARVKETEQVIYVYLNDVYDTKKDAIINEKRKASKKIEEYTRFIKDCEQDLNYQTTIYDNLDK